MITKYKLFIESKLSNIATIIGDNNDFINFNNQKFDDTDFISSIYLKKYNKNIKIDWNHNKNHNIKKKINNRTQIHNISEFNEIFEKVIIDLFNNHFNEFNKENNKYDLFLTESNIHILIILDYNKLFNSNTNIFVLTILPNYPGNIDKIIKFNY